MIIAIFRRRNKAPPNPNTVHSRRSHQIGRPLANARGSERSHNYRAARVSKRSSRVRNVLSERYWAYPKKPNFCTPKFAILGNTADRLAGATPNHCAKVAAY